MADPSNVVATPTGRPVLARHRRQAAMLRAGFLGCNLALVLACLVVFLAAGRLAAANCLVAAAVTLLFFSSGMGVQVLAGEVGGTLGLGITLFSFLLRAGLLGALFLLYRSSSIELHTDAVGIISGVLAGTFGWVAGLVWTDVHGRWPTFDEDPPPMASPQSRQPS